jgi:type VI secretion system protein ImpM
MIKPPAVGLFGKLPAHGDFIYRHLPTNFINSWDAWLQGFIACGQEQLGEDWLDIYLTSPIWRFAFSAGVIDEHVWAGIMLPSVDRVGRYFPFSIMSRAHEHANPLDLITQSAWFETVEALALQALEGELLLDDLAEKINQTALDDARLYHPKHPAPAGQGKVIRLDENTPSPTAALNQLFSASMKEQWPSYSVWSTQGSQPVAPCLFCCQGLPPLQGVAAMLDGHWEPWGWCEPLALNAALL